MQIPDTLRWLEQHETGAAWLARLPALLSDLIQAWGLEPGTPYEKASVSFVVPAVRGGEQVVLKIQWPHAESLQEAAALATWDGRGAVQLLAHDENRHALLLERCRPGTCLSEAAGVDALGILIGLLPRLWRPCGPQFHSLRTESLGWASTLVTDWEAAGKPCERKLIDAASEFIAQLANSQGEQFLVHQDLHGENLLSAEREPWLVIDPKPLAAEREFSLAPIVRSFEFGHSRDQVVGRLNRLASELALDRDRACRWAFAQTVAWSFDSRHADRHYETARWLLAET